MSNFDIQNIEFDVVIFVLPWEVNAYKTLIDQLTDSIILDRQININLYSCLCVSDDIVDWKQSNIEAQKYIDEYKAINHSSTLIDHKKSIVSSGNRLTGCVDWRRRHIEYSVSGNPVIWLDCDLSFPSNALSAIRKCSSLIDDPFYIITPQLPRMWDDSWDGLVHKDFSQHQLGHCYNFDGDYIRKSPFDSNNPQLRKILEFKFAGGWLTVISSDLLKLVGIPASFRPYGEEDTYLMQVCEGLVKQGWPVSQYLIEDLLVAPDFKLFDAEKDDLVIDNDSKADAAFNKAIKDSCIETTLARIGDYENVLQGAK